MKSRIWSLLRPGSPTLWDRVVIWSTIGYSLVAGSRVPFYYVLGHPRSGTNWISDLPALTGLG